MKNYPLFEGAVVALVAVACLVFQLTLPSRLPTEDEYQSLKQVLEQEAKPGDLVVLHPWWTERARLFTPQGLPVAGWQGSDDDAHELHQRLWVIDQPSLPRAASGAFFEKFAIGRKKVGDERVFGHLHLTLWENGRAKPVRWSLEQALRRCTSSSPQATARRASRKAAVTAAPTAESSSPSGKKSAFSRGAAFGFSRPAETRGWCSNCRRYRAPRAWRCARA
jgi:hypothetical protein